MAGISIKCTHFDLTQWKMPLRCRYSEGVGVIPQWFTRDSKWCTIFHTPQGVRPSLKWQMGTMMLPFKVDSIHMYSSMISHCVYKPQLCNRQMDGHIPQVVCLNYKVPWVWLNQTRAPNTRTSLIPFMVISLHKRKWRQRLFPNEEGTCLWSTPVIRHSYLRGWLLNQVNLINWDSSSYRGNLAGSLMTSESFNSLISESSEVCQYASQQNTWSILHLQSYVISLYHVFCTCQVLEP